MLLTLGRSFLLKKLGNVPSVPKFPSGSGGTVSFKYDPFGRRVQKSSTSGTTNYLYDGVNVLEEVDNSGNMLARYPQGQGIDEPLAELRSATTSYYQQDGLGSVSSLSNSAAALANTYTYDSFGKLAQRSAQARFI